MNETIINQAYAIAKERYAALGVDTGNAMEHLKYIPLSIHCWQADDVSGFENQGSSLSGGIQVTGNYPGKARNIDELRADILKAKSLIAGVNHRLNLHAIYGDFGGQSVDRNEIEPAHFQSWMEWGKENGLKLDFNTTSFSHPKSGNLTLSNPDDEIRNFWIEHTKRCRTISEAMGLYQGSPCFMNLWIHDGSKEIPVNRLKYRRILEQSLDEIFATEYGNMRDCLESKLFGIGLESYTVGSYEFYLAYALKKNKIITLDTGHFHLTESVADKISSILLFVPEIMLHVSRPVRWDSDHVVILNDDLQDLMREIVRCEALHRIHIGLDYFDATINRIGAYAIGCRAVQKAMLRALLAPSRILEQSEEKDYFFERLALREEAKSMPWSAVWDMFCLENGAPLEHEYVAQIQKYEREVTGKR
jgi:L-rhamnose isomerase